MDRSEAPEGWAKPDRATKYHFFRNNKSLCGRLEIKIWDSLYLDKEDFIGHYENCIECNRRRAKELQ